MGGGALDSSILFNLLSSMSLPVIIELPIGCEADTSVHTEAVLSAGQHSESSKGQCSSGLL